MTAHQPAATPFANAHPERILRPQAVSVVLIARRIRSRRALEAARWANAYVTRFYA